MGNHLNLVGSDSDQNTPKIRSQRDMFNIYIYMNIQYEQ